MKDVIIAKRYAKALLEVALEQNVAKKVESDLKRVTEAVKASQPAGRLMLSTIIPRKTKFVLLSQVLAKMKVSPLVKSFMALLVYNNRAILIFLVVRQFEALMEARLGIKKVEVKTAHPLEPTILKKITSDLEKYLTGAVRIENHVDPRIIGGMIVKVDSKLLDGSIATKLEKIKRAARF